MMPFDRGVKRSGNIAMQKAKLLLGIFGFRFSDAFRPRCKRSGKIAMQKAKLLLGIFGFRFSVSTARKIVLGFGILQFFVGFYVFLIFFLI